MMNLYQINETAQLSDHHNLLRAHFAGNHQISFTNNPILLYGSINQQILNIKREILGYLRSSKYAECIKFIDCIPMDYFEQAPILFIYKAIGVLYDNYSQDIIQNLSNKAKNHPQADKIEGEITALNGLNHTYIGNQELGLQLSLKALRLISPENLFFRNLIERNLGTAYTIKGNFREAARWYENLLLSSHKLNDNDGILAAYNNITSIRKIQGQLNDADVIYKKALKFINNNRLEKFPHGIKIIAGYGQLLIQRNEISKAKFYLRKAIEIAKINNLLLAHKAYQDLSEVYIREHDLRSALANIQDFRHQIQHNHSNYLPVITQSLLATEARIHLKAGRKNQAYAWLTSCGFDEVPPQKLYLKFGDQIGYLLPIAACIYLGMHMEEKALDALNAVIPKYLHAGTNTYLIRALNALAITNNKIGNTAKASQALKKSIKLAKADNNIGEFIFFGKELIPLLKKVRTSETETEFYMKLISALADSKRPDPFAMHFIQYADPLSNRELDVLELIAQGMTNREIGSSLFLSTNTIKSHSINIYKKLEVSNRSQAVSKARLLGLLPAPLASRDQIAV
jgi:LuxR family transcriptional regulator, maltose regulon positive regulatory protein